MKHKTFLKAIREDEIVAAIQEAEQKSSGEIRVFVSHRPIETPVAAAQAAFVRLGMTKTRERNGVLIFVAPRRRKFAVIGDEAVHAHCGEEFWLLLADEMSTYFKKGELTEGLVHGVRKAGELLAQHFPHRPEDRNELPDRVAHD